MIRLHHIPLSLPELSPLIILKKCMVFFFILRSPFVLFFIIKYGKIGL